MFRNVFVRYDGEREWSLPLSAQRLMTPANLLHVMRRDMGAYLWVVLGSALGGLIRYAMTEATLGWDREMPWGTILINVLGSFVIGFFGTLTLNGSRYEASENVRLFVMVGVCGGFTTFSAFSLQTLDLLRSGAPGRALLNVALSIVLGLTAVALGYHLGHKANPQGHAIAETAREEYTG